MTAYALPVNPTKTSRRTAAEVEMSERDGLRVVGATDEDEDEAAEIRYSLTALGEAAVNERRGRLFRGFGPCAWAAVA